jgi:hypothetical protein
VNVRSALARSGVEPGLPSQRMPVCPTKNASSTAAAVRLFAVICLLLGAELAFVGSLGHSSRMLLGRTGREPADGGSDIRR